MIVLDCSAAVDMVRETEAGRALRQLMLEGEEVISSQLFLIEVSNAFWKYHKAGLLDEKTVCANIEKAIALVDEFCDLDKTQCLSLIHIFGEMDHQHRSLKSQFKLADKLGAVVVAVLGPDELAAGQVKVRNMRTHQESAADLAALKKLLAHFGGEPFGGEADSLEAMLGKLEDVYKRQRGGRFGMRRPRPPREAGPSRVLGLRSSRKRVACRVRGLEAHPARELDREAFE